MKMSQPGSPSHSPSPSSNAGNVSPKPKEQRHSTPLTFPPTRDPLAFGQTNLRSLPEKVNRWYATDFMPYRLIGPVVMEIYDSPHLKTGVFHRKTSDQPLQAPGHFARKPENIFTEWADGVALPVTKLPYTGNQITSYYGAAHYADHMDDPTWWYYALAWPGLDSRGNWATPLPGEFWYRGISSPTTKCDHEEYRRQLAKCLGRIQRRYFNLLNHNTQRAQLIYDSSP